ncbi:MAG: cation-translocating P-type ATPase [Siphonobacter aquaeclarae]|nr:cation-translocating P-type ATPase [Siphonobacter aquaeclarae]
MYVDQSTDEVLHALGTAENGLTAAAVAERQTRYGYNEVPDARKTPVWKLFLHQFQDFMILVLIATAVISGFLGELTDTLIIAAIILLNAVIGFVQEFQAGKAMEALRQLAGTNAVVLRDGSARTVPARELVPGDVLLLEAGNSVPADIRLLVAEQLVVNESSLTGESLPVSKQTAPLPDANLLPGDQTNMAFKGTFVTKGRGRAVVVRTGGETEQGKIAGFLQEPDAATPLQRKLAAFGRTLVFLILGICAVIFLIGYLRGESAIRMLMTVLSLAVAVIPEALPAVITISLALGARKMVRKNVLIRKLPAVETLGSVTCICTDKTGTLTRNEMAVERMEGDEEDWLLRAMALNNDVQRNPDGTLTGEATEMALYDYAEKKGFSRPEVEKEYPRVAEIPFDADRKCMTTIHRGPEGYLVLVKGAMDVLETKAATDVAIWKEKQQKMLEDGLRVLGFAMKKVPEQPPVDKPDELERDLTLLGMAGIIDPPREEAAGAVKECQEAGIKTVMITGDHPVTAATIARRLGILEAGEAVVSGAELATFSAEDLEKKAGGIRVYARVTPSQKLDIVRALQKRGDIVAMTGDGVNDAPALKHADIGIAMGITGTDVSREVAHLILLDDHFATIVAAVREGRTIFGNIRKFIRYVLTGNTAELLTLFLAPLLGLPVPLLPIHILWINLVTDGLPGIALTRERGEPEAMKRPPRNPDQGILAGGLGIHVAWVGTLLAAITLGTQAYALHDGNAHGQTMVFTVLCLGQLAHVMAIRSEERSLFSLGLWTNKPLLGSVVLTVGLQAAIIYVPFLNNLFHTQPLSARELLITVGLALLVWVAVEVEKAIRRFR